MSLAGRTPKPLRPVSHSPARLISQMKENRRNRAAAKIAKLSRRRNRHA